MSKHKVKKSNDNKFNKVMDEFKQGKLKSSDGKIVTDYKQALAIAYSEAGLTKKDLQKAEILNKARVFKSQLESELKKELSNENNIVKDIVRYLKSNDNPRFDEVQKSITDKYKIDKSEVQQYVLSVSKSILEKAKTIDRSIGISEPMKKEAPAIPIEKVEDKKAVKSDSKKKRFSIL